MLLAVPETKTKLYGDRSFAACAPRLWNALPVDIKNSESLKSPKFEHSCSASAIEYKSYYHIIIIIMYRQKKLLALFYNIVFLVFLQKSIIISEFVCCFY